MELVALANLDGCWQLSFRETKPEFLGLLCESLEYLDSHNTDFMCQLGGACNFGAGIVDTHLINPLYEEHELKRVFNRSGGTTNTMGEKDEQWVTEYRPAFVDALETRIEEGTA